MNTGLMMENIGHFAAQNPLAGRLAVVSIEMAVLAAIVTLLVWALRIRTPRVRALLWLIVLAKPVLGLVIGTPIPAVHFKAPVSASAAVEFDRNRVALHLAEQEFSQSLAPDAGHTRRTRPYRARCRRNPPWRRRRHCSACRS